MDSQKIKEGNILISDFLGWRQGNNNNHTEFEDAGLCAGEPSHICFDSDLLFHTDWNWLMLVVEKIKRLHNYRGIILHRFAFGLHYVVLKVEYKRRFFEQERIVHDHDFLEQTYTTIVEFIKWYNGTK